MAKHKAPARDIAAEHYSVGLSTLSHHPLFSALVMHADFVRRNDSNHNGVPREGFCVVQSDGRIRVHPTRRAEP